MLASAPPPVEHPVGRTPALAWVLCGFLLLGLCASWLAMVLSAPEWRGVTGLAQGLVLLGVGLGMFGFWRNQAPHRLRWDGARWHGLNPPRTSAREWPLRAVQVRLDFQWALLLQYAVDTSAPGRPRWLWVQRGAHAADWHLLRCALYFSASTQEPLAPP